MKKYIFITLGTISLVLGLFGLFIPGLPTTPFILLTGALYAKSSPQLYKRLEDNKLTGKYLKRMETGLSWRARLLSISIMWAMVCITAFYVFDADGKMRYIMLGLGGIGTVAQLIVLRKRKPKVKLQEIQQVIENRGDIDSVDASFK